MRHRSFIYGFGLEANVALAQLAGLAEPDRVDVRAVIGSLPVEAGDGVDPPGVLGFVSPHFDEGIPDLTISVLPGPGLLRFSYSDGNVIVMDDSGTRIWAVGPTSIAELGMVLVGPALGYLARLRGLLCLHASAIAVGDSAVALVGPSGSGKSSTAAAFAKLGYPVLTDDKLVLLPREGSFQAQPSYPSVRLWPDSVEALFGHADGLPRVSPEGDKRLLRLQERGDSFQAAPLPLAAIYFLGERSEDCSIEPLAPQEGLMELISDLRVADLLGPERRRAEFAGLGRVANSVPLRRVRPSTHFARIEEMCLAIVDDFSSLQGDAASAPEHGRGRHVRAG